MFDFQEPSVYQKAKELCKEVCREIKIKNFDRTTNGQLRRASLSIMINIAEGYSRFGNKDRRHFMIISRGSAFECAAILEFLHESQEIETNSYQNLYAQLEEISKMLFALIRKLKK